MCSSNEAPEFMLLPIVWILCGQPPLDMVVFKRGFCTTKSLYVLFVDCTMAVWDWSNCSTVSQRLPPMHAFGHDTQEELSHNT